MNNQKQATLFQTWGARAQKKQKSDTLVKGNGQLKETSTGVIDLCDEDDDNEDLLMAMAIQESLKDVRGETSGAVTKNEADEGKSLDGFSEDSNDIYGNIALLDTAIPEATDIEDLPGFDKNAGHVWIYPTNYPVREYQYNIVKQALFNNTMVVLPTGLGKTFIAAVLMYNMYRWYPQGKIVFMAPTKPLVAQQIEACYNIMGIPQEDTAEMTGAMNPTDRKKAWQMKRVFFLTPQVLTNDLSRTACPAEMVKCVVVDEAHKATGNHAYCQVVREIIKYNENFRILALSATPGSDIKAVQQVIANLLVSHIELRSEDSIDIKQYSHERKVDKIVVPLGQELAGVKEKYLQIMTVVVMRLRRMGVLYNKEAKSLSKFLILKAREAFRQDPPQNLQRNQFGAVEGDFALCMSLYHGYDLLLQHGLRSLFNYLEGIITGEKGYGRTKTELMKNADFNDLMENLRGKFNLVKAADPSVGPSQMSPMRASQMAKPFEIGHPKMAKLRDIVLQHFQKFKDNGMETRIMIFSQFRDSVNEITEILNRHRPLVKVMSFIGQSSAGKSSKGFTQKEQLKVMKQFRDGGYNTLVSTCVGEEGLDIGDVDLIVCFDAHKSPIRLVQRMGRTGRKREGRIVMLVTEGKEEQIYNQSQYSKRSIHKAILNGKKSLQLYPRNPRMIPQGLNPNCHKMHITVNEKYNALNVKGKACTSAVQKNKITNMCGGTSKGATRSKARNSDKKDGFLTTKELQYWNDNFKVDEKTTPVLPDTKMLSLGEEMIKTNSAKDDLPVFNLSEWMPWQNQLQEYNVVDHSIQSHHLVELVEFMDIQGSVDGDEDNYGLEMQMYLREEDILRPGQTNSNKPGILKYCTSNTSKIGHAEKKKSVGMVKKKRSDSLPEMDLDEENSSDSDLPGLGDMLKVKEQKNGNTEKTKKKNGRKFKETNPNTSRIQIIDNKDSEDFVVENNENDDGDKLAVIEPMPDLETGRFSDVEEAEEQVIQGSVYVSHIREKCASSTVLPDIENETMEIETNNYCDNRTVNRISSMKMEDTCSKSSHTIDDEQQKLLSDLLPDFAALNSCNKEMDTDISLSNSQVTGVRTPPRIEELNELIKDLDERGTTGSSLDILELIDEWEKDKATFSLTLDNVQCSKEQTINVNNKSKVSVVCDPIKIKPYYPSERQLQVKKHLESLPNDNCLTSPMKSQVIKKSLFRTKNNPTTDAIMPQKSSPDSESDKLTKTFNFPSLNPNDFDSTFSQENEPGIPFENYETEAMASVEKDSKIDFMKASKLLHTPIPVLDEVDSEYSPEFMSNKAVNSLKLTTSTPSVSKSGKELNQDTLGDSLFTPNNSLFEQIHTPICSNYKNKQENSESKNRLENVNESTPSNKKLLNTTQITFTQALAFVHDSFNTSCNQSIDLTKAPIKSANILSVTSTSNSDSSCFSATKTDSVLSKFNNSTNERNDVNISNTSEVNDCINNSNKSFPDANVTDGFEQDLSSKQNEEKQIDIENIIENKQNQAKTIMTVESADDFGPQFDLGFDIDEEFEVIPPSPPDSTQPFTQTSKASATATTLIDLQTTSSNPSPSLVGGLGVKFGDKTTENYTFSDCDIKKNNKCDKLVDFDDDDDIFSEIIQDPLSVKSPVAVHTEIINYLNLSDSKVSPSLLNTVNSNPDNGTIKTKIVMGNEKQNVINYNRSPDCVKQKFEWNSKTNSHSTPVAMVQPLVSKIKNPETTRQEKRYSEIDNVIINASEFDESMNPQFSGKKGIIAGNHFSYGNEKNIKLTISDFNTKPLTLKRKRSPVQNIAHKMISKEACSSYNDNAKIGPLTVEDSGEPPVKKQAVEVNSLMADVETMEIGLNDFDESMQPCCDHGLALSPDASEHPCADELDESIIDFKRKKKLKAIITSPETPDVSYTTGNCLDDSEFKTPLKPAPKKMSRRKVISSDSETAEEESPIVRTKKQSHVVANLITSPDMEDSDFQDDSVFAKRTSNRVTWSVKAAERRKRAKPKDILNIKKKKACGFIEVEAELSDEDGIVSSDEQDIDGDQYDASFVNDATQLTQDVAGSSPNGTNSDMRAIYLQSVKSPTSSGNFLPGRFKLKYNYDRNMDIYSQVPNEDEGESCYMADSFCVDSDEELDESEYVDEPTIMEKAILPRGRRPRTTMNSNKNTTPVPRKKPAIKLAKDEKRKRIKRLQDSSSSEEEMERNYTVLEDKSRRPMKLSSSDSSTPSPEVKNLPVENSNYTIRNCSKLDQQYCDKLKTCKDKQGEHALNLDHSPILSGFTQIPSLQSRCQQRMHGTNKSVGKCAKPKENVDNIVEIKKPELKSPCNKLDVNIDKPDFDLSFDLGLGDLVNTEEETGKQVLSNEKNQCLINERDEKNSINTVTKHSAMSLQENTKRHPIKISPILTSPPPLNHTSLCNTTISELHSNKPVKSCSRTSCNQTISKEERLRLSRLKQEEFKRKHAQKLQQDKNILSSVKSSNEVTILDYTLPQDAGSSNSLVEAYTSPMPNNVLMTSILPPISPAAQKLTVFVDSREINGAQDVISNLRAKYHYTAIVTQLQGCDYILSNRMAVERKCLSDFTNGANKNKLIDRIKHMTELFERGVVIVEKDRIKQGEKDPHRPLLKSKYVETILASLCQMQIKVYFSESQENTADVLSQLIDTEKRKGFTVNSSIHLSETQQQLMKFYLSLPKISFVTALNFVQGYRTLQDFIKSPIGIIEKKGHISRSKAQEIYAYLKHQFNPQMIGIKK